jgi:hypothetical protein
MAEAVPQPPAHHGKQMKSFADMSKHDDDQTSSAKQYQIPTDNGVAGSHGCHVAEMTSKPKGRQPGPLRSTPRRLPRSSRVARSPRASLFDFACQALRLAFSWTNSADASFRGSRRTGGRKRTECSERI